MAKILVRAPNWLGDAVMCTPFLKRLRETRPTDEVFVLCQPGLKDVFQSFPGLQGVLTLPRGSFFAKAAQIREGGFDIGYVLPPSFSSAFLFFAAGIPEIIGYSADFRLLLLTKARKLDERFHYVRRYLGLLGEPGREIRADDFFFPKPESEDRRAETLLASRGISFRTPALAVGPGSQSPARRWPSERFADLINALSESDWPTVFLLGSPGDRPVVSQVEALCKRKVVNLCGATDLVVLGDLLRLCSGVVTNESGLMHVAWAVGTPAVILAGPSDTRLTSPFTLVQNGPSRETAHILQRREVPCVPCVRNDCYRPAMEYKECMKKIEIADVISAVKQAFRSGIPANA